MQDDAIYVNEQDRVRFVYGPTNSLEFYEITMDVHGRLRIRTPQASLTVRPDCSNVILVDAVDRS